MKHHEMLAMSTMKDNYIMTIKEISEITSIPYETLRAWKPRKDYRGRLYKWLKTEDRSVLVKIFQEKILPFKRN